MTEIVLKLPRHIQKYIIYNFVLCGKCKGYHDDSFINSIKKGTTLHYKYNYTEYILYVNGTKFRNNKIRILFKRNSCNEKYKYKKYKISKCILSKLYFSKFPFIYY